MVKTHRISNSYSDCLYNEGNDYYYCQGGIYKLGCEYVAISNNLRLKQNKKWLKMLTFIFNETKAPWN